MKAPTFNGSGRAVPAGEVLRWSRRRGEAGSSARIIIIITARTGFLNALTKEPSRRFTLLCAALLLVRGNETGSEWVLALWMKTWTNVYKCAR